MARVTRPGSHLLIAPRKSPDTPSREAFPIGGQARQQPERTQQQRKEAIVRSGTAEGQRARRVVELRSDTFTLPSPQMIEAMARAELGDDVYGEDPTVNRLEALAAEMLGKDAACLMPSGTMSNLASILAHCPRGSKVIVGDESDIYVYEGGGAAACGGVAYHPVANKPDGTLDLNDVRAAFPPDAADPQFAAPALLCLENPQNHSGGRILPLSYLDQVAELARQAGIPVHMDGARVFNAALASGTPVKRITACADSVQFCLSKGLGAPVGSMVGGSADFIARVRRVRKVLGGGMRQAGVLAAAGIVALQDRGRLREDHETARRLADGLAAIPGIEIRPEQAVMNMVFFRLSTPHLTTRELIAAARERGVVIAELGSGRIRCVTHYGVGLADIGYALDVIRTIVEDRLPGSRTGSRRTSHDRHEPVVSR
jgi:threonine aldolase